ncbi:MAG: hypothetical protein Q7L55_06020 [Actinomycetota bacterium]|nr:hypothetical protein [Actinomycetota bacterium]
MTKSITHARHGDWLRIPDAGTAPVRVVATYPAGVVVALAEGEQRFEYADLARDGAEYATSPTDTLLAAAAEDAADAAWDAEDAAWEAAEAAWDAAWEAVREAREAVREAREAEIWEAWLAQEEASAGEASADAEARKVLMAAEAAEEVKARKAAEAAWIAAGEPL